MLLMIHDTSTPHFWGAIWYAIVGHGVTEKEEKETSRLETAVSRVFTKYLWHSEWGLGRLLDVLA